ncbi:MAG: hypothetical protein LBR44_11725 [Clostridiales Family XIII bacterium]|jgi:uncharacterized membrane protein|nr:hypothetical protein [Clostridiales Family XIII bacterium]
MSGIPKKEKWILWVLLIWILMAGGPGLVLFSKPEFIGYFPELYIYCIVMWIIAIVIHLFFVFKIKFWRVDEQEKEIKQMEADQLAEILKKQEEEVSSIG